MKTITFTATAKDGKQYRWSFWYDKFARLWFLRDYEGYVRPLEQRWIDSVPRIHLVLENHDMSANIS